MIKVEAHSTKVPNFSPTPNSICSNCTWTFVANSNALFWSNQPCSCINILAKYFSFKWCICLSAAYSQKKLLIKAATKESAPYIINSLTFLSIAFLNSAKNILFSSSLIEFNLSSALSLASLVVLPVKYAIRGLDAPLASDPINPIIIKKISKLSLKWKYKRKTLTSLRSNIKFFFADLPPSIFNSLFNPIELTSSAIGISLFK